MSSVAQTEHVELPITGMTYAEIDGLRALITELRPAALDELGQEHRDGDQQDQREAGAQMRAHEARSQSGAHRSNVLPSRTV